MTFFNKSIFLFYTIKEILYLHCLFSSIRKILLKSSFIRIILIVNNSSISLYLWFFFHFCCSTIYFLFLCNNHYFGDEEERPKHYWRCKATDLVVYCFTSHWADAPPSLLDQECECVSSSQMYSSRQWNIVVCAAATQQQFSPQPQQSTAACITRFPTNDHSAAQL